VAGIQTLAGNVGGSAIVGAPQVLSVATTAATRTRKKKAADDDAAQKARQASIDYALLRQRATDAQVDRVSAELGPLVDAYTARVSRQQATAALKSKTGVLLPSDEALTD